MLSWRNRAAQPRSLGSTGRWPVGFGGPPKRTDGRGIEWKEGVARAPVALDQSFAARRRKERAGRPRSPEFWCLTFAVFVASLGICRAQDALNPPETGELVISATRFPIPEEDTPAS